MVCHFHLLVFPALQMAFSAFIAFPIPNDYEVGFAPLEEQIGPTFLSGQSEDGIIGSV